MSVIFECALFIYIYIYIYMCVCVCVCVYLGSISSLMHISLNDIDLFCLHVFACVLSVCPIETTSYASI